MHPARGTTMATETAPARRVAAARPSTGRRRRSIRLALATASAGLFVGLAFVLPGGATPAPAAVAASPVAAAPAAVAHMPPPVGPTVAATAPRGTRHARTPNINLFTATPARLPAAGGAVHLFAIVQRASHCTFSSTKPLASLPATRSCASGSVSVSLTLPRNTTGAARTFHFQIAARGPNGPSSAGPVTVVQAAPVQAAAAPRITLDPADASVTAGSSATFNAAAAGSSLTVQWQVSADGGILWNPIAGADAPSYSLTAAAAQSGYRYRAVFTSHGRSATTLAATLTVTAPVVVAPSSTPQAASQPVAPSATAAADSAPQITLQPRDQGETVGTIGDVHRHGERRADPDRAVAVLDGRREYMGADRRRHLDELHARRPDPAGERLRVRGRVRQRLRLADDDAGHADRGEADSAPQVITRLRT